MALLARTGHFDADYASTLSADAAPGMLAVLPRLAPPQQAVIAARLVALAPAVGVDWRSWNAGVGGAERAVQRQRSALQALAAKVPAPPADDD